MFVVFSSGDYVYWTDWQRRAIERVNKTSGKQRTVVVDQLPDIMGLAAVSTNFIPGKLALGKAQNFSAEVMNQEHKLEYINPFPTSFLAMLSCINFSYMIFYNFTLVWQSIPPSPSAFIPV